MTLTVSVSVGPTTVHRAEHRVRDHTPQYLLWFWLLRSGPHVHDRAEDLVYSYRLRAYGFK